jgi:hypothetical protein
VKDLLIHIRKKIISERNKGDHMPDSPNPEALAIMLSTNYSSMPKTESMSEEGT